jgi:manganese/iron transport system permease protein/iron/zinc/copper transport system permease protein
MDLQMLLEPLGYEFFRHGLIAATLTGALCGLMGVTIVLRRMSYIGHGLSHAIFGGAVVSALVGWNFFVGAGAWGFLSALLIQGATRRRNIGADAAIGIITTASFALGVALISRSRAFEQNFESALFGNILGVTPEDLLAIGVVAAVIAVAVFVGYKQLLFTTFDSEMAPIYGVPTRWVDAGFALALAATIVVCMNVVGVTLIAAALVIPPVAARMLSDSFGRLTIISVVFGALCGLAGMFASYYWDIASGPAIILLAAAAFGIIFLLTGAARGLQVRGRRAAPTWPVSKPMLVVDPDAPSRV